MAEKAEIEEGIVALLMEAIDSLNERVTALEGRIRVPADPLGPLTRQVLAFLDEHAPMKFNPSTIAANLGTKGNNVSSSLQVLMRRSMIKAERSEGRGAVYRSRHNGPRSNREADK